jgi:predicted site-specific integrase-resolvase
MQMEIKKSSEDPLMLGLKSIAKKLDVSTKTVMRMHQDGQIRLYRMRGKLFAKYEELKEDVEKILEPRV